MAQSNALLLARDLSKALASLPGVLAVALGGSLAGDLNEDESDVDLYVYADDPPPVAMRSALIDDGRGAEIDNRFWETGDEWEESGSGIAVDVTYRSPRWIEDQLDRVLVRHQAATGYTTAVWHNVRTSKLLADSDRWYEALQTRANVDYPEELRQAIVAKNQPILQAAKGS
ncbi:MAG TPA: nucleotidyltransferase domain-containing protein [Thermomicrobiales bacterium]|nr:nucleotidyltransferase domain-containing protein [Thermomicrobiales bacterium]